jgi:hypothetical protein
MLEAIQALLLPYLPIADIDQILGKRILATGGTVEMDGRILFEPASFLNSLFYDAPEVYEGLESQLLDREERVFSALENGQVDREDATYRITQHYSLRTQSLPHRCALHLFLPVPRAVTGLQEVAISRCIPAKLADNWISDAGLLYDVPFLVGYGNDVLTFEIEFEVRNSVDGLRALKDPALRPIDPPVRTAVPTRLVEWSQRAERTVGTPFSPMRFLEAVLDEMETTFEFVALGPSRAAALDTLLDLEVGDIRTLTHYLSNVLQLSGFGVRVGAAQQLYLREGTDHSNLSYAASTGYDHPFLSWSYPEPSAAGTVDLGYFRRWNFGATEANTRSSEFRETLMRIGSMARRLLREGIYPIDLILSATPPPSRVEYLGGVESAEILAPVDTQLVVDRTG